jgi:hypothetical protein
MHLFESTTEVALPRWDSSELIYWYGTSLLNSTGESHSPLLVLIAYQGNIKHGGIQITADPSGRAV